MVKRALLVGINYRGTSSQLNGCINDVCMVRKFLIEHWNFPVDSIKLLTDDTSRKPTKQNILKHIGWLVKNAQKGDSLYFHYSGHGSWTYDKSGDEADGKDESIVPLDYKTAGMIIDDDLKKCLVDSIKHHGVNLTCIMDCCHSGTGIDLKYTLRCNSIYNSSDKPSKYNRDQWSSEYSLSEDSHYQRSKANVICLSGCDDDSVSSDAYIGGKYQGALTWGFLKVMKKNDYKIKYKRLLKDLRCLLKIKGYTQIPQMSFGRSINRFENTICL